MQAIWTSSLVIAVALTQITAAAPQMRDTPTDAQLTKQYRQASQESPMRDIKPAEGAGPSIPNRAKDLLESADIICFGGVATLVPKRAILNTPPNFADRIKFVAGSKFIGWAEFFAQNRGWITAVEVSSTQAEGNQVLPEEVFDRVRKSKNLVVAVFKGQAISVMPVKVPDETPKTVNAKQSS